MKEILNYAVDVFRTVKIFQCGTVECRYHDGTIVLVPWPDVCDLIECVKSCWRSIQSGETGYFYVREFPGVGLIEGWDCSPVEVNGKIWDYFQESPLPAQAS